ncbi:hypothetical protein ACLB1R_16150 [Escherichia coli]
MGVTHRFVGTEPFCRALPPSTTRICATGWKRRLSSAPPIELVEIERLLTQEMPISASRVRQLLAKTIHGYRAAGPCSHCI